MRRWLILLLVLPAIACGGLSTPPPTTPTVAAPSQTNVVPTEIPPTIVPTQISATDTVPAPNQSGFPDPNAFTWKQIASGLQRPTDLEPDSSGRLFILEKLGRI